NYSPFPQALFIDFYIPTAITDYLDVDLEKEPNAKRTVRFGTTFFPPAASASARVNRISILAEFIPGLDTLGGVLIGEVGTKVSPPKREKKEDKLKDAFLKRSGGEVPEKGDTWGMCCVPARGERER